MDPTLSAVHTDQRLTILSVAFLNSAMHAVAMRAFPRVPVAKQSDLYVVWDKGDMLRDTMAKLSAGAGVQYNGIKLANGNYSCDVYADGTVIPYQVIANEDPGVDVEEAQTRRLANAALIRQERDFGTNFFTTGVWTTDITGSATPTNNDTTRWDDAASEPTKTIDDQKIVVQALGCPEPNTLIVGAEVDAALRNNPSILDRIKHGGGNADPAKVTPQILAALFGLDKYLVSKITYTTSNEGAAATTTAFALGKHALLCYAAPEPSRFLPSAGYTFSWAGLLNMLGGQTFAGMDEVINAGISIRKFDDPENSRLKMQVQAAWDQKLVSADCGVFYNTIVS